MQFQVARQAMQLRDDIAQFLETMGSGWGKYTRGNHYAVLDAKGSSGLYALCISIM